MTTKDTIPAVFDKNPETADSDFDRGFLKSSPNPGYDEKFKR